MVSAKSSLISIILLTKDRPTLVQSQIEFWQTYPVNLIVADGSDKSISSKLHDAHPQFNISILESAAGHSIMARIAMASLRVSTKYVMMLPDDEVFLWTGITSAISQLEALPDIASAGGISTIAEKYGTKTAYRSCLHYGVRSKDSRAIDTWSGVGIDQESPIERLLFILQNPQHHKYFFYRVMRRDLLTSFAAWDLKDTSGLHELILSALCALYGKNHIADYPFWIRTKRSNELGRKITDDFDSQSLNQVAAQLTNLLPKELVNSAENSMKYQELIFAVLIDTYTQNSRVLNSYEKYNQIASKLTIWIKGILKRLWPEMWAAALRWTSGTAVVVEKRSSVLWFFPDGQMRIGVAVPTRCQRSGILLQKVIPV